MGVTRRPLMHPCKIRDRQCCKMESTEGFYLRLENASRVRRFTSAISGQIVAAMYAYAPSMGKVKKP
jgi:hypothetical protein